MNKSTQRRLGGCRLTLPGLSHHWLSFIDVWGGRDGDVRGFMMGWWGEKEKHSKEQTGGEEQWRLLSPAVSREKKNKTWFKAQRQRRSRGIRLGGSGAQTSIDRLRSFTPHYSSDHLETAAGDWGDGWRWWRTDEELERLFETLNSKFHNQQFVFSSFSFFPQ